MAEKPLLTMDILDNAADENFDPTAYRSGIATVNVDERPAVSRTGAAVKQVVISIVTDLGNYGTETVEASKFRSMTPLDQAKLLVTLRDNIDMPSILGMIS